jgi:hypothetical protein
VFRTKSEGKIGLSDLNEIYNQRIKKILECAIKGGYGTMSFF